ncbi:MAG: hypothetical protein WBQ17_10200 [Rhizomicrobium sp.]
MNRMKLAMTGVALGALTLAATPVLAQMAPNSSMSSQTMSNPSSRTSSSMMATNAVMLSSVSNPKTTLASAAVKDSSGQQIGHVKNVVTDSMGKPTKIDISLTQPSGTAKTVAVRAGNLRYDQQKNALMTTSLTASQVDAMPAISSP